MKHHILEKLWGHGIVTITSYYKCNIHKVANYFTGFINKNDSDPESKKGRLKYYTSGTDLFSLPFIVSLWGSFIRIHDKLTLG